MKATVNILAEEIRLITGEFSALKAKVDNIDHDLDNTKQTMEEIEHSIENEMEERMAKMSQSFIRGAKTRWIRWKRAIRRKDANQNNDPIGFIAELGNKEEKTNVLKGAKKLKGADGCKDIYIKPNETKKQRNLHQNLRAQLQEIRAAQTTPEGKYPAIRNNRIVF